MIDLDLLEHVHDVAWGRATWEEVLARLRAAFSTEASMLVVYGTRPEQARSLAMTEGDGRPWQQYADHYAAIDPFAAAMQAGRIPEGRVVTGDDVVPTREFLASEYYNDWFRPNGIRHTAGAFIRRPDGLFLQLGMPRAPGAGPYGSGEVAQIQRYFNHISRAVLIGEALGSATVQPDFDRFARAFGLTPAEAKLVEGLFQTGSLKRSAGCTHRSYHTLRAQLRMVFEKTGTHTQPQLMCLVHRGAPDA